MQPDTEVVRVGAIEDIYELPTMTSPLARVVAVLQDLPLQVGYINNVIAGNERRRAQVRVQH